MSELDLDPSLLANLTDLRSTSINRIKENVLPSLSKLDKEKARKLDHGLTHMPDNKLIDVLIEHHIEKKCDKPSFIMNHPLIMSPLAKSHA